MRYKYLFALSFFIIIVAPLFAGAKRPEWLMKEPMDPAYFSSVVTVSKTRYNYKDQAYQNAVKNISMQIGVQVQAALSSSEVERGAISFSDIESVIMTSTSSYLKNVQIVDSFESARDYSLYCRLNKAAYYSERNQRKAEAMQEAEELLDSYEAAEADYGSQISLLLKAMEVIEEFLDMDLSTFRGDRKISLYSELMIKLNELPKLFNFSFSPNELSLVAKQKEAANLALSASVKKDGYSIPQSHLPLCFGFAIGEGEIESKGFSDEEGEYQLRIGRINSFEKNQLIRAGIDKDYYLKQLSSKAVKKLFSALEFKQAEAKLTVAKPRVLIQYSFDEGKGEADLSPVMHRLSLWNLEASNNDKKAQYRLLISTKPVRSEYIPALNQYAYLVDMRLSLIDSKSGATLYSGIYQNIKANDKDEGMAKRKAEQAAIQKLSNEILTEIIREFIL